MKLGKLNYIYNLDKHHAANKGYYHALVFDSVERRYENLIITDSEMKKLCSLLGSISLLLPLDCFKGAP